jgi:hypothetical protein
MKLRKKIYLYANSTIQRSPKEIMKIYLIEDFFICHRGQRHRWCTLSCEYLHEFIFERIRNGPNGIIRGLGDTYQCRKPEVKNLVALSLYGLNLRLKRPNEYEASYCTLNRILKFVFHAKKAFFY